jgi:hypothetical protein
MMLLILQISPALCYFITLRFTYNPQHSSRTSLVFVVPLVWKEQTLHPNKTTGKIIVLYILIFTF